MKKLAFVSSLLIITSAQAYAWAPLCDGGKTGDGERFATVARNARAVEKKLDLNASGDGNTYVYGPVSSSHAGLRDFLAYRGWIVAELNKDSLLRAQIADKLYDANQPRSDGKFEYLIDADAIPCRRERFSAKDIRLVSLEEKGEEIILTFQVVTSVDARLSSTFYGEQFEAKYAIQKADRGFTAQLSQYPNFTREVVLQQVEN